MEYCFGVVDKFCNFAFCTLVNLFVNGKLGLVPTPLSSPTFLFQCTQLISNAVEPGSRFPVLQLSLADRSVLVQDSMKFASDIREGHVWSNGVLDVLLEGSGVDFIDSSERHLF